MRGRGEGDRRREWKEEGEEERVRGGRDFEQMNY
jgi:hypothetical protein